MYHNVNFRTSVDLNRASYSLCIDYLRCVTWSHPFTHDTSWPMTDLPASRELSCFSKEVKVKKTWPFGDTPSWVMSFFPQWPYYRIITWLWGNMRQLAGDCHRNTDWCSFIYPIFDQSLHLLYACTPYMLGRLGSDYARPCLVHFFPPRCLLNWSVAGGRQSPSNIIQQPTGTAARTAAASRRE